MILINFEEYLEHYGTPRHSGRYPWGSGGNSYQNSKDFLANVADLRKQGLSEVEIARGLELTTTELRAAKTRARNEVRAADIAMAQRLRDKGWSTNKIAERMERPEPTIRSMLAPGAKEKNDILITTANVLKQQVDEKTYIDISVGTELHMGITRNKLSTAVSMLEQEGYNVRYVKVKQLGTGNDTSIKLLVPPGVTAAQCYQNLDKIQVPFQYSEDRGRTYGRPHAPLSVDSKRIQIKYADEGGAASDGAIYVRPGVPDVSIGASKYAQVRIAVDGTHYLKGMAIYKDDLPPGVDLVFHTNKSNTGNKHDAMKPMKDDPENPFGASITRQITKLDKDGNHVVTSSMNIIYEEGTWSSWSNVLSTQMLSKQNPSLAKQQLDATYKRRHDELEEIKRLTNPAVRKKLLETFANNTDSAAVHLKAVAMPNQRIQVILPVPNLKDTEVYAPNYTNGTRVALIRYPHGGVFEIPELTVNNRHPDARKLIGNADDAIGINPKVAQKLSGADFDGDFVTVIPNTNNSIKSAPSLEGLKNFDPQRAYPKYEGMLPMTEGYKQYQMGEISNLISDMTVRGAPPEDIVRAVRHSMVVIDAVKHELNYKQSYRDNGIRDLQARYQERGASTLFSRARSPVDVPKRKPRRQSQGGPYDATTGERVYETTAKTFVNKKGKLYTETQKSKKLFEAKDAHDLSSGTPMESVYADHSNRLKALANEARKEFVATKPLRTSESAKVVYKDEVASLRASLRIAQRNAPLERQALVIANAALAARIRNNPNLDKDSIKKIKYQELERARLRTGAKKQRIEISDKQWQAIQSGAINQTTMEQILRYADPDQIRRLATPKVERLMTDSQTRRAQSMVQAGKTQAEIAEALGVSLTTVKNALKGTA